ncbi:hypothetical protein ABZX75_11125 [Streptomyces sp. NPDC003038]|uniref:hypothetical protein n=1 Tax=unclassified Streptomyces TaxID=2593676 RepID=UPI0033AD8AE4
MRNRRLIVSAAVIAAGVGLTPGMAQAADPANPVAPVAQGVAAPAVDLAKAGASNFKTFTSPADRTVRKALPTAKDKAAASPQAQAQVAAGNPDLAVVLNAKATSAHGFELDTTINSADASLNVTIDWGDGTFDLADPYGAAVLKHTHIYPELGDYTVRVTVADVPNQTHVSNELTITTAGSDFTPYGPTRLLDTRNGTGATKGKVPGYGTTRLKAGGNGKIPAGVTAVALNVTAPNATSGGHVTVYGSGGERPTTSNVNFEPGQTVPNLVIVPVGQDGCVNLYNGGWEPVDLIADVTGYFGRTASSGYTPRTPERIVDTREGNGPQRGQVAGQGSFTVRVTAGGPRTAVALNITVTNPREAGHLTAYPGDQAAPTTSNVNFTAGQTVANSVIVPVAADGSVTIRNGAWAPTDVIVELVGMYSKDSTGSYMPVQPTRSFDTRDPRWPHGPSPARGYTYSAFSPGESGIAGYVLNTTVTNTRGPGFLSVAPDPNTWEQYKNKTAVFPDRPVSSTLNWTAGKTVPNLVQASSGYNGIVDFWNQGWEGVDLIVDIFGYYETQ